MFYTSSIKSVSNSLQEMTRPSCCSLKVINVEYLIHSILHLVSKGSNITNAHICSLSATCTVWNLSLRKLNLIYSMLQETNDVTAQLHALVICFDNTCVIYRHPPPPRLLPRSSDTSRTRCNSGLSTHMGKYIYTDVCGFEIQTSKHTGP
jgi:hypothetical protein